jgi:hypothetical protein
MSGLPDIGLMGASRSMAAQAALPRQEQQERNARPCFETAARKGVRPPQHEGGASVHALDRRTPV